MSDHSKSSGFRTVQHCKTSGGNLNLVSTIYIFCVVVSNATGKKRSFIFPRTPHALHADRVDLEAPSMAFVRKIYPKKCGHCVNCEIRIRTVCHI